jgi:hypothetical protein
MIRKGIRLGIAALAVMAAAAGPAAADWQGVWWSDAASNHYTTFAVTNLGTAAENVEIRFYAMDGTLLGADYTQILPGSTYRWDTGSGDTRQVAGTLNAEGRVVVTPATSGNDANLLVSGFIFFRSTVTAAPLEWTSR